MKQLNILYRYGIFGAVGLIMFFSCKKDLPKLPAIGNQGVFCKEQFHNNSFDPVGEWIYSSAGDYPPCPNSPSETHINQMKYDLQFAKNNPNIIYYKKGSDFLIKYNFCTNKEEIIAEDGDFPTSISNSHFLVGNNSEIFYKNTNMITPSIKFECYLSHDDFNTYVIDTGFIWNTYPSLSDLIPGEEKVIYNRTKTGGDHAFMTHNLNTGVADSLSHLKDYYIHQWLSPQKWIISSGFFSSFVSYYEYNPSTEVIIPISGLQNINKSSTSFRIPLVSEHYSIIIEENDIKKIDRISGTMSTIFDFSQYNNLYYNDMVLSPDEKHLVVSINYHYWTGGCAYESTNYVLVIDVDTGDFRAIDFDN